MIRMEVRGVKELQAKFAAIKLDMYKALAAALVASGMPVVNSAKTNAPVLTGNLMRSLHLGLKNADINPVQPKSDGKTPRQMPINKAMLPTIANSLKTSGKAEILVGTDVVYAEPQEFLYKPYLRPALDGNRQEVQDEVRRAVKQLIRKVTA